MATVGSHDVRPFAGPVSIPVGPESVRGNDETLRKAYVAHDSDATIHVQSSTLANRPAFGTAGRLWITTDGTPTAWLDTGSAWVSLGGSTGSAAWTETEVDFGSTPTWEATFTITDAAVSATTEVAVVQSGTTATGRAAGDALWDAISYAAVPASGSFTLYAAASPGPVVGKRKLLYQVGS